MAEAHTPHVIRRMEKEKCSPVNFPENSRNDLS